MELAKKYNDIQWEEEVVYGTKMLVSEPLAMILWLVHRSTL